MKSKNNRIINKTKDYTGKGFQILSVDKSKNIGTKDLDKKLESLKLLVSIYTYIFAYAFLRMIEIKKTKSFKTNDLKIIDDELEKIYGQLHSKWPEDIRNRFTDELFYILPEENLFKFFRETIYYLIFTFSSYACKYIKSSEGKLMLDKLFELFENSKVPWLITPPEEDAFRKYSKAENPILKYNAEIGDNAADAHLLFDYQTKLISILTFIIPPTIDKIFKGQISSKSLKT